MLATAVRDFERALRALAAGRLRVRIPRPVGLYRRVRGALFHFAPELFIQTGGGTDFGCPGGDFRLRTREVCLMPSGVPHRETPVDLRTPYEILVCGRARDGFLLRYARATKRREIHAVEVEHLVSPRGRAAFRYLDEAVAPAPERYQKAWLNSLIEAFLITLLGELHGPSGATNSRSPLVAEAEKLARTLLGDPGLSVARLAASLGCSADYLSRRFHEERNITFSRWITRERVAMACDQLSDPRRTVAEVGWACGFNAPSYFIRVFRRQTGLTPKAWRASQTRTTVISPRASRGGDIAEIT